MSFCSRFRLNVTTSYVPSDNAASESASGSCGSCPSGPSASPTGRNAATASAVSPAAFDTCQSRAAVIQRMQAARDAGVTEIIVKPVTAQSLLDRINAEVRRG